MKKGYLVAASALLCSGLYFFYPSSDPTVIYATTEESSEEEEGYDGPMERDLLEFEKIKDPSLGYVPTTRLGKAIEYTENQKEIAKRNRAVSPLLWQERGPVYDTVGPSNGNSRAGYSYTAGRIRAVLVDTLNDPTGNTVLTGGVAGGLWRCTNFLSSAPTWQAVNDYFSNMAISSICQDPSNPNIMYFATGEATSNADAVFGKGVWKSTDAGSTWTQLTSTTKYIRNFKIECDASGNIYLATRALTAPIEQPFGLLRSRDGGATWTNITPSNLTTNASCTDIEISSTGKLHASFGYLGSVVNHVYTADPANVTPATWNKSAGIRTAPGVPPAQRMELATLGDVVYAVTVNSAYNVDSCYKSVDGGTTFTKQNAAAYPAGVGSGQGWYNLTLTIDPANPAQIIVGGLDAYKSTNHGATVSRLTYWVSTAPYVHADHHFIQWWYVNGEPRILIGCDGGLFLSRDGGTTWADKNKNLAIKQFYSAAIHPASGSNYLLAGAQDNGVHQLKYAGLASSIEVTGGDGAFVHINQKNPNVQFGSYVYNNYRRSLNGGQTWQYLNFGNSGLFINPFDYDDDQNMMYAAWSANNIFRWPNAHTSTSANLLAISGMGTASAFKVSPNTPNRLFIGSNTGKLYRLDNAHTATTATLGTDLVNITGPFPTGFLNCVNVGSNDNFIVAVFTNYGVNNVWYSSDAGATWSAIDGNLPDMPVRWAVFHPQYNNRLILATEAGVYTTNAVNGARTQWVPSTGFPTVRTDMIKLRTSDNTLVAATHGRGLFTAQLQMATVPEINFALSTNSISETTQDAINCRGYKDYQVELDILSAPSSDATIQIGVKGGSTAVRGIDFDFTTNNQFHSPSDELIFAAGTKQKKSLTLRIYDDAEVEGTENFTLNFSVTSATDAIAGEVEEHTVTLIDNDRLPSPVPGITTYKVGAYNSDIIATSPFAGNRTKHRVQSLFTANELRAAGITSSASIKSLAINVLAKNSTKPFNNFTISMANTASASLNFGFTADTYTPVFSGNYTSVVGMNTFAFSTPFVWDGVSNVVVQFCFDNGSAPTDAMADFLEGNSYPLGAGVRASTFANYTSGSAEACALPAALVSDFRINATFGVDHGVTSIATGLNMAKTEYLNAQNDLYIYAPSGEILARIKNLSGYDYGCTNVLIDRAGTGASSFWNNNKKNFLMDKTLRIVPANTGGSGPYEVTLYFTKEEKEGWEKATGQSWNDIQLVRTSSRISEVTPQNAKPNNNGTVQEVSNAVKGEFGNGYTLTATFEGNFGGFGAGTPGRMNTVLIVKANKKENAAGRVASSGNGSLPNEGIELSWTTSSETNSTAFELEKSYDGKTFRKIATVPASRSKSTPTTYKFTDNENAEQNYYRIKMLHADGYVLMSKMLFVENMAATQQMFVLTNPFRNDIRLRFAKVPKAPMTISLFDVQGKLVERRTIQPGSSLVLFDLKSAQQASKGIYNLDVYMEGKHYQAKLMKE